jgi:septum formation protein
LNERRDLVLASGSPRRRELLASIGWPFRVDVPDVCEEMLPGEPPEEAVVRLARAKAGAAARRSPGALVVAADTLVALGGVVLGKPVDRGDSLRMIRMLGGAAHSVFTGVAVRFGEDERFAVERTEVEFRPLSDDDIAEYVECGEGDDKAGAYAIQGRGALLVSSVHGDYFNVVGLPLCRLSRLMEEFGWSLADQWRGCL